jgi:hypothetical protein
LLIIVLSFGKELEQQQATTLFVVVTWCLPRNLKGQQVALVVLLHGCKK